MLSIVEQIFKKIENTKTCEHLCCQLLILVHDISYFGGQKLLPPENHLATSFTFSFTVIMKSST